LNEDDITVKICNSLLQNRKNRKELLEMSKNKKNTVVCLCGGGTGTHILAGTNPAVRIKLGAIGEIFGK
jgi:hypothetical protein